MGKKKVNIDGKLKLYLMHTKQRRKKLGWRSKLIYPVKTINARSTLCTYYSYFNLLFIHLGINKIVSIADVSSISDYTKLF